MTTAPIQFDPSAWLGERGLRAASLAARGLWIDILTLAAESPIRGELRFPDGKPIPTEDLARIVGEKPSVVEGLIEELERRCIFDRAEDGAIVSRRMVREAAEWESGWRPDSNHPARSDESVHAARMRRYRAKKRTGSATSDPECSATPPTDVALHPPNVALHVALPDPECSATSPENVALHTQKCSATGSATRSSVGGKGGSAHSETQAADFIPRNSSFQQENKEFSAAAAFDERQKPVSETTHAREAGSATPPTDVALHVALHPEKCSATPPDLDHECRRFLEAWNAAGLKKLSSIKGGLRQKLSAALVDPWWASNYLTAITRAASIEFLAKGISPSGIAREVGPLSAVEFLNDPDMVRKLLDGDLDEKKPHRPQSTADRAREAAERIRGGVSRETAERAAAAQEKFQRRKS